LAERRTPGWEQFANPGPQAECLCLATYFHLRSAWKIPRFLRFTASIREQLNDADGLIGYTLRSRPLRRQFWTLSAWLDQKHLLAFVRAAPHLDVMSRLRGDMAAFSSARWEAPGSTIPPLWSEALRRLHAETA
jgi:hypothetical protein